MIRALCWHTRRRKPNDEPTTLDTCFPWSGVRIGAKTGCLCRSRWSSWLVSKPASCSSSFVTPWCYDFKRTDAGISAKSAASEELIFPFNIRQKMQVANLSLHPPKCRKQNREQVWNHTNTPHWYLRVGRYHHQNLLQVQPGHSFEIPPSRNSHWWYCH